MAAEPEPERERERDGGGSGAGAGTGSQSSAEASAEASPDAGSGSPARHRARKRHHTADRDTSDRDTSDDDTDHDTADHRTADHDTSDHDASDRGTSGHRAADHDTPDHNASDHRTTNHDASDHRATNHEASDPDTTDRRAAALRAALADRLVAEGAVTTREVAAAVRTVPRHLFTPGLPLEQAYANQVVFVRRDRFGVPTSSVSAPDIQAIMLEQADIHPGMRVLEIGSGGYDAALMAELVGPEGRVTTVDIDREVTERARRCLDEAGYGGVRVVLGDAEGGVAEGAPYDRIVVTVEAWDLPPAWIGQLAPRGRIVVPLLLHGMTRSIAFDREDDHLVSRSTRLCGFVKMQGAGSHAEEALALNGGDLSLEADDVTALPPAAHIEGLLRGPRAERWSGVRVWRWEPWDTLPLWLATAFPGYCQLTVHVPGAPAAPGPPGAPGSEPLDPALAVATPAVATLDGFAHLTARSRPDGRIELGVHAFGSRAEELAGAVADSIAGWDRDQRVGPGPIITAWPIDAPVPDADLLSVRKHVRLAVDWPHSG